MKSLASYTLTETGYGQTTTIEIDTNGPQTISLSQTETDTNSSTTTGNNITGDSRRSRDGNLQRPALGE